MTFLKIKRTRLGDWHVADCRPCLSPRVSSSKMTFSDSSLAADVHCMKKRSNWRGNLFEDSDNFTGSSTVEPTVLPYLKKARVHSENLYPHKYIPNDVCSPASSVDSCGNASCAKDREALSSDANSSTLSRDVDSSTLLRRKVGSYTLVVRWRGSKPQADTSTLLRRKVGSYTLVVRCGGIKSQARINHRSELKSYRRTLEELYAKGSLSWELEGYLAELRSKLHISNDEHLNEGQEARISNPALQPGVTPRLCPTPVSDEVIWAIPRACLRSSKLGVGRRISCRSLMHASCMKW